MGNISLRLENSSKVKFRVLLVEDQPIILFIHRNFLQSLGCIVDCAENGEQALTMLEKHYELKNYYDIVFMDMGLPGISGMEVVRLYRERELQKRLPIVALTAHGGKDDKKSFIEVGGDEVVVKPVTVHQLRDVLKRYCEISA